MTERLQKLFLLVEKCKIFGDVGCDHGYISEAVLEGGKANFVVATDISPLSLEKCKSLLADRFVGKYACYATDGLKGVNEKPDEVFIAGMGGKEIISVLSALDYRPERLVLQPMKSAKELREYLLKKGYGIEKDFMFFSLDKHYDVIVAVFKLKTKPYTDDELKFGRDNLSGNNDFQRFLDIRISVIEKALKTAEKQETKQNLQSELNALKRLKL